MPACLTCKRDFINLQKHWQNHPECLGQTGANQSALELGPQTMPLHRFGAAPTSAARAVFADDLKEKVSHDLANMQYNQFMMQADVARFKLACSYWCNMMKQQIYNDLLPVFESNCAVERLDQALRPLDTLFTGLETPAQERVSPYSP